MGQQFLRGTIPILPEQGQDPMVLVSPMVLGTTFQLRVFHGSSTRTMNQDLGQQRKGMDWRGRGSCLVLLHPCLGFSCILASSSPALPPPPQPIPVRTGTDLSPVNNSRGAQQGRESKVCPAASGPSRCSLALRVPLAQEWGQSWITFPFLWAVFVPGTGGV